MRKLLLILFITPVWSADAPSWWEKILTPYHSLRSELEIEVAEAEEVLTLDGSRLTTDDAMDIAAGLKSNKKLKSLDLANNQLKTEGVKIILEALKKNKVLQKIDFSGNGCHHEHLKGPIGELLDVNRTLQVIAIDVDDHSLVQTEVNIMLMNPRRGRK